ncbi:AI-2E family transporter [Adhaeribacter radiodurans]|uniref:AI-2E family transporter n=1 Tax=Adhaeribacter radiodurans TaxID=2745197 RepID=A0A7L7LDL9_9BACT|nr:AI-2E family transporter [Adhaeribacter radiodurans]QMU30873.1 AI-2E family transporter [Adhaeribacter radiodurans]
MKTMPVTVRRSIELMGLFFLGWILVLGKPIIAPILMAFFLSMVMLPVYRFFNKHLPEVLAITLSVLVLVTVFGIIIWFFTSQISNLLADLPVIRNNINIHLSALSAWINKKTSFSPDEQVRFINQQSNRLLSYAGNLLQGAVGSVTSVLLFFALLPLYTFLILYYKNLIIRFVFLWFPKERNEHVREVLSETETIIKSYLIGLLIQITYMTVLVGGTLFLVGIKHALLIGVLFAFLNLIPYIGALIGNILGVLLTLASSQDLWPIFTVLITIAGAQFLDNNILMPRIVGSKVRINVLATLIGVFTGGAIAGIAGMFLSLPIIAILKVIFDRTDKMNQWGVLLGDERPSESPMREPQLREQNVEIRKKLEEENEIELPKTS